MRVLIGYDAREPRAYRVAAHSLQFHSGLVAEPLDDGRLRSAGLLWRPVDRRVGAYDLTSNAPCSTDFAISRFLTPILGMTGWVLFVDSDVVFLGSARHLLAWVDPTKAVWVVKHDFRSKLAQKMDGRPQVAYERKGWSSVMLFNCDHPANRRLTLHDVNTRPGLDLHQFYWLADSEIGELGPRWNWLVGEQPMPDGCAIAHFTNGGPFLPGWEGGPHDDIWTTAWERLREGGG